MKEIQEIIEKASLINKLKNSEEELFKYINSSPDAVDLVFNKYGLNNKFVPVNCLRFLLANEIKKGNTISSDLIKQIIGSLEKKDISNYYNVSDEFQKSLDNKNISNRSWYASWKEFSILFPFIVSDNELEEVNKKCAVILTKIIKDLNLENVKTHIVDFLGPQNFGADASWCAIIPKEAPDVQSAHQIFFQITSTGIKGGLYKGDKVSENDYLHKDRIEYDTIEEYIKDISQELHIWKDLNDSIDFELTKNKRSFISSLKTNSYESNRLFFNIIDNVIADLDIEDKQNIVFSTTRKRLVFHVGKRYCFRLNNNKFGFITESDYKINNLENKPFSADAGLAANFYSKAEKNDVTLHYSAISRAINAEILRDNSTQEKDYDNKVFRRAVFDKEFRVEFLNTEENQVLLENKDSKNQFKSKVWFVCQGSSFTKEQGMKYLFAPKKGKGGICFYYWKFVSEVKKGDVIVNYAYGIKGISIAKKDAYSAQNPHPQELWQNDGWKVDLNYFPLEPSIQYKEFDNYSKQLIKSLENIKGPIQKDGGVKQGYLFEFNLETIKIIREKYGRPFPSTIEELLFSNKVEITELNKQKIMKNSKNQILFGPPGTGKTFKLSHEYFNEYTDFKSTRSREELLDDLLTKNKYTWFDIIAAIIKDKGKVSINDILNHELIQSKARVQNGQTSRQTVWAELLEHGQLDCENIKRNPEGRREPMIIWKDDDSKFDFNNMDVEELIIESVELLDQSKNLSKDNVTPIKRYEFVTFHQAFSYEDFIEGIKPVMDEENEELKYAIKDGVFKQICNRANNDPENRYALFIDEINRGNVANIFGELITLIEPDKRAGMDNALSVKLPYSKTIFSVPNNLDIIGTMNTADRSVEALDTALRRRFEFEEMLPNSSLLSKIRCEDIKLDRMLNTINGRIEKLLDKDHQIGHSYFMNSNNTLSKSDLQGIFKNKIMPLLQEYFYGDFGKIGLVLGNSFIKENKEKTIFSKFTYDDHDLIDERKVYQLSDVNKLEAADFKSIYEKNE